MLDRVVVVTDSTAYLPRGWADKYGIQVVPVQVVIAGQVYDETDDEQAEVVSQALADWKPVTTSRPSPERFQQTFRAARKAGATHVVVATLSAALSATHESAVMAARESAIAVTVVDSRTIAMGLGFGVIAGAELASTGASPEAVAAVIEQRVSAAQVTFYVDTMEYLRRGGRVSAARAAVGQVLQVKPLLRIDDGRVVMLEKVRTAGRALDRLADIAVEAAGLEDVDIAVQYLSAPGRAGELAARIGDRLPAAQIVVCAVGGVVGAHVGPGMVATVVSPRVPR